MGPGIKPGESVCVGHISGAGQGFLIFSVHCIDLSCLIYATVVTCVHVGQRL